jgi:hypothetical protein
MTIPLNGLAAELLFIAAVAAFVFVFMVEITLHFTLDQWTRPRPQRPRSPWTDRTGT